ncbi:MAG TPA: hypothetical protein VHL05_08775 [Terriglobales bacterium]|nr:hypothetical protein [Terriglobales bacterium]
MSHAGTKEPAGQVVDSGSFGVFVNGQRVATETFSIQQSSAGSTVKSQLREEGAGEKATQTSQMQLTSAGELIRYDWQELSPSKTQIELVPNEQFLTERITLNPGEKPAEQPFLLPASTVVLDNNFFVHRELLAWRYLAQNCKAEAGQMKCVSGPISFGVVVPEGRTSMRVSLEPTGNDKVQIRGSDRQLPKFALKFEGGEWALWLDDQDHFKVVKIAIPAEKTEVIRD